MLVLLQLPAWARPLIRRRQGALWFPLVTQGRPRGYVRLWTVDRGTADRLRPTMTTELEVPPLGSGQLVRYYHPTYQTEVNATVVQDCPANGTAVIDLGDGNPVTVGRHLIDEETT